MNGFSFHLITKNIEVFSWTMEDNIQQWPYRSLQIPWIQRQDVVSHQLVKMRDFLLVQLADSEILLVKFRLLL